MTTDARNLTDVAYVYALRERLYAPGAFGRAAVMVGAGFSRNAVPKSPGAAPFPLWTSIAGALYRRLHPADVPSDPDQQVAWDRAVELSAAGGGMLRLAQEYEATFGRSALDNLIRGVIPDDDHDPADLHRDLLELPWADVFTTNYDTLLERARQGVYAHAYDVVVAREDLPYASRPRIVKLHGSLPSTRPFVFTEEDYRRFPTTAAPFVGTVRQSLIENDLVLLGFSGEDPNFLAWLGWVRDELAEASPAVYLCGVLDLSPGNRKILESRGVTPIDLGPLVPRGTPDRHGVSARWLLDSLRNGRPPSGLRWPTTPRLPPRRESREGQAPSGGGPGPLPPPPGGGKEPRPNWGARVPHSANPPVPPDDLRLVAREWAKTRAVYPGWIWTPQSNRERLWNATDPWRWVLPDRLGDLDAPNRIEVLDQYLWRLSRTYAPVAESVADAAVEALREGGGETGARERVAVALLDVYRSETPERYGRADDLAASFPGPAVQAARCYARATRALGRLDGLAAVEALDAWPHDAGAEWELRRAGLLLEVERPKEAKAVAASVRARARSARSEGTGQPYLARSVEGAAQLLLDLAAFGSETFYVIPDRDRDDELTAARCNPRAEMRLLEQSLAANPPGLAPSRTTTVSPFGEEQSTYHFRASVDLGAYLAAFSALGVLHDAGVPLWFGKIHSVVARAAIWLADLAPETALDALVRTLDYKRLRDHLDPLRAAALPDAEVRDRVRAAEQAFRDALPAAWRLPPQNAFAPNVRAPRVLQTAAVLLGRLSFRVPDDERLALARLVLAPLQKEIPSFHHHDTRDLVRAAAEVFPLLTPQQTVDILPDVAALPLQDDFNVGDPFRLLQLRGVEALPEAVRDLVRNWVETAETDGFALRAAALTRLHALYISGLLPEDAHSAYARALWAQTDDQGLPNATTFATWALLAMPEPEGVDVDAIVREALLTRVEALPVRKARGIGHGPSVLNDLASTGVPPGPAETPRFAVRWIDWRPEEADRVMAALQSLWEAERKNLATEDGSPFVTDDAREMLTLVPDVLRRVVIPAYRRAADPPWDEIERLRSSLRDAGIPARRSLVSLWTARRDRSPQDPSGVEAEVRQGLASANHEQVADAVRALYDWGSASNRDEAPSPPEGLMSEVAALVTFPRSRALVDVLYWTNRIVEHAPAALPETAVDRLCSGLDILISETDLPDVRERLAASTNDDRVALLRRPQARALAAELAFRLGQQYGLNESCERILAAWQEAVEKDPFREVRAVPERVM